MVKYVDRLKAIGYIEATIFYDVALRERNNSWNKMSMKLTSIFIIFVHERKV